MESRAGFFGRGSHATMAFQQLAGHPHNFPLPASRGHRLLLFGQCVLSQQVNLLLRLYIYMGVSKNNGTPKSSILIGFSIINHPFWVPIFLETSISMENWQTLSLPYTLIAPLRVDRGILHVFHQKLKTLSRGPKGCHEGGNNVCVHVSCCNNHLQ